VGGQLEELRENAGLKRKDAAKALERSTPTMWRIETGQTPMRGIEVEAMCRLYGAAPETGACVEVATWRTTSYSNGSGACVEVGTADGVRARDTKDRGGVVLSVSAETWEGFTAALR
jgi:DNA-binding XRE family transcriptional regulator